MNHVYKLICPITDQVRWVGVTVDLRKRRNHHEENTGGDAVCNPKKREWIDTIKAAGKRPIIKSLKSFESRKEAFQYEERLTDRAIRMGLPLLNIRRGPRLNASARDKFAGMAAEYQKRGLATAAITIRSKEYRAKHDPRLRAYNEARKQRIKDQFGRSYESIREAERKTGCKRPSIKAVLDGRHKQTKGYVFFYEKT